MSNPGHEGGEVSDPQAVFFEAFDGLERLSPGSEASTLRALEMVRARIEPRRILDIGCGAGAQTLVLARHSKAAIVAVDTHAPFLEALTLRAQGAGAGERVSTAEASMLELGRKFPAADFDVLWAEGSVYVIGFDRALREWRPLLRSGGVLVCSEVVWLTDHPSDETRRFWNEGYPAIRGVQDNIAAARAAGYAYLGHFVQPATDWTDHYYAPLGERVAALRVKYAGDAAAIGVLDGIQAEIDLYTRAGDEYGYVFYVVQRTGE